MPKVPNIGSEEKRDTILVATVYSILVSDADAILTCRSADLISAFGGIVAFSTTIDEDLTREIRELRSPTDGETQMFYKRVITPSYTEKGLEVLCGSAKQHARTTLE
ncbi:hypothetical protein J5N97_009058 [Dioscorea zingiberensis]|uniref:Uncharacterized protein n=1 Tax=Dioscorea zingiberensis TaxID=325984 RepID=A0A9D5CWV7_9LILI|nr:hypothetical protein J5N97_009058 [Dioscorea zingiberensis]